MGIQAWEDLIGKKVKIKDFSSDTVGEYKIIGITNQTVMLERLDGSKCIKNKEDCFFLDIEEDEIGIKTF